MSSWANFGLTYARIDATIANTFIQESVQLIINSIVLFEKGYFDCAYYSMRQALEIATTMVYLSDIPNEKKSEKLTEWKSDGYFPQYGQMMKYLKQNGYVFSDMKDKMKNYFNSIEAAKMKINKYVHKQGLEYFYVMRYSKLSEEKNKNKFTEEFKKYLEYCIGVIAVMRLAIDPLPILLADEEIYYRSFDTLTLPYTEEFINKYIGIENINDYKKTDIFLGHYTFFMQQKRKLPSVAEVAKNQYIDKGKIEEILTQIDLMSEMDIIAVMLADFSVKVSLIYCLSGLQMYLTSTKTKRKKTQWSSKDFKTFSENNNPFNMPYDEAFISVVKIHNEFYFIEHNEIFNYDEINLLKELEIQNSN